MKTSNSLCDLNLNINTFDAGTNRNNQREVTLKSFENVVIIAITCLSNHITKKIILSLKSVVQNKYQQ